jgi:hypothetical protein
MPNQFFLFQNFTHFLYTSVRLRPIFGNRVVLIAPNLNEAHIGGPLLVEVIPPLIRRMRDTDGLSLKLVLILKNVR